MHKASAPAVTKRAAPQPKISTENKTFADPVDLLGTQKMTKRASAQVRKAKAVPITPPSVPPLKEVSRYVSQSQAYQDLAGQAGKDNVVRGGNEAGQAFASKVPDISLTINGKKYGGREQLAQSTRNTLLGGIGAPDNVQAGRTVTQTGRIVHNALRGGRVGQSTFDPQKPAKGSATRKAMSDTTAMPKRIMARDNQSTGAEVLWQKAGLKKDITSAFVPSIGVKRGKKSDLQAPAKNVYPPAGKKK